MNLDSLTLEQLEELRNQITVQEETIKEKQRLEKESKETSVPYKDIIDYIDDCDAEQEDCDAEQEDCECCPYESECLAYKGLDYQPLAKKIQTLAQLLGDCL